MGDIDRSQNPKCKGEILLSLSLADPNFSDPSAVKLRCTKALLFARTGGG